MYALVLKISEQSVLFADVIIEKEKEIIEEKERRKKKERKRDQSTL